MRMRRENGVYNFTIRVPIKKTSEEDPNKRTQLRNRYAMLAEFDEHDDYEGSKGFHRQGFR